MASNVPPTLRPIAHYVKIANENATRDPVVYYWCLFYAVQTGMQIDKSSPDALKFLTGLLATLEMIKKQLAGNEAVTSEVVGQAHLENFAMKLFNFADKKEKAGQIDKTVVHAFYTAGHVLDTLSLFGDIDEEYASVKKYAKWKSTQIFACLKDGTPYVPSSQQPDDQGFELPAVSGGPAGSLPTSSASAPQVGFNPSGPSSHSSSASFHDQGAASTGPSPNFGLPSVPGVPSQPPAYQMYPSPPSSAQVPPAARQQQPTYEQPAAPVSTGGQPTFDEFEQARKFTKYALSAIEYEDVKATVDNLRKALSLLEKYA